MKKIITMVLAFSLMATFAFADMMIQPSELPKKAQDCIKTLYPSAQVQYAEKDFDSFDARLSNGAKIEFYTNGDWEKISDYAGIPDVAIPANILKSVKQAHPQAKIIEIEKDWNNIEVKLNNNMELKLDSAGKILAQKMDD